MKYLILAMLTGCTGASLCKDFQVVISEKEERVLSDNLVFDIRACKKDLDKLQGEQDDRKDCEIYYGNNTNTYFDIIIHYIKII